MSEMKHTPGPWKVRDRTEIYAAGYFVGTTRGNHPEPESVMIQDEANARLIASAPDLLAALNALRSANGADDFNGWHTDFAEAIELARAAIAKATQP